MMTQVLRMEDGNGLGPFFNQPDPEGMSKAVGWLQPYEDGVRAASEYEGRTHPHHMLDIPGADVGSDLMGALLTLTGSPWKVGVKDQKQFYHWFPKHSMEFFNEHGYKLGIYDVPKVDIKYGKYQLMFNASKAKLIKEEPLTDLE
jgi:hypothetical protein